jgi:predicted ATPase
MRRSRSWRCRWQPLVLAARLVSVGEMKELEETLFVSGVRADHRTLLRSFAPELRAARGLARLWRRQGEVREAHDLLAPVLGFFTEGFDTPDLIETKALLEEIA